MTINSIPSKEKRTQCEWERSEEQGGGGDGCREKREENGGKCLQPSTLMNYAPQKWVRVPYEYGKMSKLFLSHCFFSCHPFSCVSISFALLIMLPFHSWWVCHSAHSIFNFLRFSLWFAPLSANVLTWDGCLFIPSNVCVCVYGLLATCVCSWLMDFSRQ